MILADGTFDPWHIGHLRYLEAAAKQTRGDTLVVNVAPDDVIRAKGREPFQTATERAECLRALRMVDEVWIGPLVEVLRARRPRVLVKGRDWLNRLPLAVQDTCRELGVMIVYTDTVGISSTERLDACLRLTTSKR